MALIDGRTKTVTLPDRSGHSVTIHQVSGRVLRVAQQRRRLQDSPNGDMLADSRVGQFEIETLLRAGVVEWTFPEPISAETIATIDLPTKVLLAAEIVALSSRR